MMAAQAQPPQLVASSSTYTPLTSSPRFEHPACASPSHSTRGPTPSSSASSSSLAAWISPQGAIPAYTGGSVYSDISSSENLDFSDPKGAAEAAERQAKPTTPQKRPREGFPTYSPTGYPFPWVLSRPATPPLLVPASAFSSSSTSPAGSSSVSAAPSPYINYIAEEEQEEEEDENENRQKRLHGSKPLPSTPPSDIPPTPPDVQEHRNRNAGSTPGCGPLPFEPLSRPSAPTSVASFTSTASSRSIPAVSPPTTAERLTIEKRRKATRALLSAKLGLSMSSGLNAITGNEPLVASPLKEPVSVEGRDG